MMSFHHVGQALLNS
ncbi:hypothetical protein AAY473_013442 [Plecturocebus cupreus]